MIKQGKYNLTADALTLRQQKPLYAGDDYTFYFTLQDDNGDPVDITNAAIKFTAKYNNSDDESTEAIVTKTATITSPTDGEFNVAIVNTDVPGPELIFGYYNVQITYVGGTIETLLYGDIEFLPNVAE